MSCDVKIVSCPDYEAKTAKAALEAVLEPFDFLDNIKPGMKIAIKANMVAKAKPEEAAVTNPVLVTELCRLLINRGAEVTVGDSPGGLFDPPWLNSIYSGTGMKSVLETGAKLNTDFEVRDISFPEAKTAKHFPYTAWLLKHDMVINFAKLKTHALTGMTCAVKNLFGTIAGTRKAEFHYMYPKTSDFCSMLVDLNEFTKPSMTIVDAVLCMEGNGPTKGNPRHMGALLAAKTSYAADLLCAHLIGIKNENAATVAASIKRGKCPDSWEKLNIIGDPEPFIINDFDKLPAPPLVTFETNPIFEYLIKQFWAPAPNVSTDDCIGCGKCAEVCPMSAAKITDKKARIKRTKCIRCFCCQEFCPKGAITVKRPLIPRLVTKI
ncbi:MAG: DUF362 domain-containing protein [Ruminococcaceae bacterium]|nr:DUF362 domain-containing protein [Oscillospiraceae bacterium]